MNREEKPIFKTYVEGKKDPCLTKEQEEALCANILECLCVLTANSTLDKKGRTELEEIVLRLCKLYDKYYRTEQENKDE